MVYEVELTINDLDINSVRNGEFSKIQKVNNDRCGWKDVCCHYALNKISLKRCGFSVFDCKDSFWFLQDYFNNILISEAKKGDIITYHEINDFKNQYEKPCAENCMHFAIIEKTNGTLENTTIKSKWGEYEVFETSINDVPDMYGNAILIWKIK